MIRYLERHPGAISKFRPYVHVATWRPVAVDRGDCLCPRCRQPLRLIVVQRFAGTKYGRCAACRAGLAVILKMPFRGPGETIKSLTDV